MQRDHSQRSLHQQLVVYRRLLTMANHYQSIILVSLILCIILLGSTSTVLANDHSSSGDLSQIKTISFKRGLSDSDKACVSCH